MGMAKNVSCSRAERPDQVEHIDSPAGANASRAASCSQSSDPRNRKRSSDGQNSLSTWGISSRPFGTAERLAVVSQSRQGLMWLRHQKLLSR